MGDEELMTSRSWRWFRARILGLLHKPISYDWSGNPVFATRLQAALNPPKDAKKSAQQ